MYIVVPPSLTLSLIWSSLVSSLLSLSLSLSSAAPGDTSSSSSIPDGHNPDNDPLRHIFLPPADEEGNTNTGATLSPVELAVDWGSPFAPSRSLSPEGSPDRDAALQRLSLLSMMLTKGLTFGLGLENGLLPNRKD